MRTIEQSDQPNSIKQAYERPDAKLYDISINKEMKQFQKFKTFTFVKKKDVPKDAKVIPSKFVFTNKTDASNNFIEKKARMCARGDIQGKYGEEWETYAPTISQAAIRANIANTIQRGWVQNQMDVASVYLHTSRPKKKVVFEPTKGV